MTLGSPYTVLLIHFRKASAAMSQLFFIKLFFAFGRCSFLQALHGRKLLFLRIGKFGCGSVEQSNLFSLPYFRFSFIEISVFPYCC